jgi:hypothetical protein
MKPTWLGCLALLASMGAQAQRVPFTASDANFSAEALLRGVSATADQCATLQDAVWARVATGEAECLRYWASGVPAGQPVPRMLVYFSGDQMAFDQADAGYAGRSPKSMQALVDGMGSRAGVPFILLARPGTFGSSGEHKQRRRELEPRLMSAALDEIRKRHGVSEFALVGLSGGGHIVASLLGWRSDIVCAVPASSVSSPKLRWERMGRSSDLTGFTDSYEPLPQLKRDLFHPKLRVFVLGDPKDSNVPWPTQTPLADRLKELGASVELVNAEGSDTQRHATGGSAQRVGSLCLQGKPTQEILDVAARGLKG